MGLVYLPYVIQYDTPIVCGATSFMGKNILNRFYMTHIPKQYSRMRKIENVLKKIGK